MVEVDVAGATCRKRSAISSGPPEIRMPIPVIAVLSQDKEGQAPNGSAAAQNLICAAGIDPGGNGQRASISGNLTLQIQVVGAVADIELAPLAGHGHEQLLQRDFFLRSGDISHDIAALPGKTDRAGPCARVGHSVIGALVGRIEIQRVDSGIARLAALGQNQVFASALPGQLDGLLGEPVVTGLLHGGEPLPLLRRVAGRLNGQRIDIVVANGAIGVCLRVLDEFPFRCAVVIVEVRHGQLLGHKRVAGHLCVEHVQIVTQTVSGRHRAAPGICIRLIRGVSLNAAYGEIIDPLPIHGSAPPVVLAAFSIIPVPLAQDLYLVQVVLLYGRSALRRVNGFSGEQHGVKLLCRFVDLGLSLFSRRLRLVVLFPCQCALVDLLRYPHVLKQGSETVGMGSIDHPFRL